MKNKIQKKTGKRWGKIKLLETSAVGIPAYDAAINKSKSLIKALGETLSEESKEQLNLEESPMGEEEAPTQVEANSESEVSEPEEAPAEAETPAESTPEPAKEEVEKGMSKEDMIDVMTKGFQQALKASETPRGLVESPESKVEKMQEVLAKKSLGELAQMNGMFKAPDMYGRIE